MSKSRYARLTERVTACDPSIILRAAARCDGHSIFDPKAFISDGLPQEVVAHLTRKYKSDGSPKGTLFVDGQPVKELSGVYGLDLLRFVASALNVQYRSAMGRGFEAQNILVALRQHLAQVATEPTPPSNTPQPPAATK